MPPSTTTDGSKKINMDLFSLTYGSVISQLINDCDCVDEVNKQLESMGYNIGLRLVEDFLAKSSSTRCRDLKDIADKIQHAFQIYLSVMPKVDNWSPNNDEFSIILQKNPLTEFVELPDTMQNMNYLNILPGVIRGALEMISVPVRVYIKSDQLKGDDETEIRIEKIANSGTSQSIT